jgi:hypothetical protein
VLRLARSARPLLQQSVVCSPTPETTPAAGGLASVATGGTFANGASTAAFGYMYNELGRGMSRRMTPGEILMAQEVYGDDILYGAVRIFNGPINSAQMADAMAPNGNIYFKNHYSDDFSLDDFSSKSFFIHEMAHVWQYQKGENMVYALFNSYSYRLQPGKSFYDYNLEQQAEISSHYYQAKNGSSKYDLPTYKQIIPFGDGLGQRR